MYVGDPFGKLLLGTRSLWSALHLHDGDGRMRRGGGGRSAVGARKLAMSSSIREVGREGLGKGERGRKGEREMGESESEIDDRDKEHRLVDTSC